MKKALTFLFFILFSGSAWADVPSSVQTYTTWGDFDTVVNTFERVALMVSDNSYHGLFFGIIVISLVFGIISAFGRGFLSGQENPLAWVRVFGTIILGVIVYQTFIQKTSQIVVYDETLNLQKTVADVPDGLIFLGYPLHPPGQKDKKKADHLYTIKAPMLFFAGTRDTLCDLDTMKGVVKKIKVKKELVVVEGGDHSFKMSKSMGTKEEDVYSGITQKCVEWLSVI